MNILWACSVRLSLASLGRYHGGIYGWFYELYVLSYYNLWQAGRIFMKLGADVMPLEAIRNSFFLISYNTYTYV
jgi:hypothetical protein